MTATQSATAKAGVSANNGAPEAAAPHAYVDNGHLFIMESGRDDYAFRAPRYGDLVACPYCDPDTFNPSGCDHCGDEGILFASEVFQ